jgi:uncharacterized membrane protein
MASPHRAGKRLAFLDWTRGLAACIMLQGHVSHSFTHKDLRSDSFYVFSQFFGGLTPAAFLFLTGVTLGFLMDSQSKKEPSGPRRMVSTLLRARYLLLIGLLFHFQMWATAFGQSEWVNIFKVDILNCMAATIALLTPLALLGTQGRIRYGALAGFAIACGSPFVTQLDLHWLNPFLRDYLVPSHSYFSVFPWGAFVAFGLSCGSVLRLVKDEDLPRVMPWAGLMGLVLIFASRFVSDLPFSLYPKADFWLDSPLLTLIKLGVILLITCWAFLFTRYLNPHRWSFVRQLGVTSLLVYWVHTELVYGRWLGAWKESLTVPQTLLIDIFVIALMVLLSAAKTGWEGFAGVPTLVSDWWASVRQPAAVPSAGD